MKAIWKKGRGKEEQAREMRQEGIIRESGREQERRKTGGRNGNDGWKWEVAKKTTFLVRT